jgi:hypothetical protein
LSIRPVSPKRVATSRRCPNRDRFWITGDPTESWATQAAEKEAAQAAKKAEKAEEKAKTDPDVSSEGPESDEDFLE